MQIYTIGHSNHPIAHFIAMLRSFDIQVLADVRSMPGSRKWPQYNRQQLSRELQAAGIKYIHMPDLGGRRKPAPDATTPSGSIAPFMGYAAYTKTDAFKTAISQLEEMATAQRVVYMCAEAEWWRCHRSVISDYLKANGQEVLHIMNIGESAAHPDSEPSKPVQGNLF